MNDFEKEQFWQALGRLYDSTLVLKNATEVLRDVAEAQAEISKAHEKRLDKLEIVQQWLAEQEQKRRREQP